MKRPKRLFHDFNIPKNGAGNHEVLMEPNDHRVPHVGDVVIVSDAIDEVFGTVRGIIVIVEEEKGDAN